MTEAHETENMFGKIRGRLDVVMAKRAVMDRRKEMVIALIAMSDNDLTEFIADVNSRSWRGRRVLKLEIAQ